MAKKKEKRYGYDGFFLMDSGLKIYFIVDGDEAEEGFDALYNNCDFSWEKGGIIWLGERSNLTILVDKVIGWEINQFEI